jgi:hypothetical protein
MVFLMARQDSSHFSDSTLRIIKLRNDALPLPLPNDRDSLTVEGRKRHHSSLVRRQVLSGL